MKTKTIILCILIFITALTGCSTEAIIIQETNTDYASNETLIEVLNHPDTENLTFIEEYLPE